MKRKWKGKGLAALLSLAMVFAMMPMMGGIAFADDPAPDAINLVDEKGSVSGMPGGQQSSVYFGRYQQDSDGAGGFNTEPVKWRVLSNDREGGWLFLLADRSLDSKRYSEDHLSTTWRASAIRSWLNDKDSDDSFISTAFSEEEQPAIATTQVDNPGYGPLGGRDTKDQVYLLSVDEVKNQNFGFSDNDQSIETRQAENTAYAESRGARSGDAGGSYWWLRSPGSEAGNQAAAVLDDGAVYRLGYTVDENGFAVRPAFHLDLGSAVFTSSAQGGKSSAAGVSSLAAPGENRSGEWKVTLADRAHQDFKVTSVRTYDGKTLYFKYTGAVAGGNEYISAIIKTNEGKVKCYGKLAPASGEAGTTVLVNTGDWMEEGDTLCIFNEQCNGDRETDFSSPLQEITIPEPEDTTDAINLVDQDGNVSGIIPTQGSSIFFGKYMQESNGGSGKYDKEPVKWRVLWDDDVKDQLFLLSDRSLDCRQYGEQFKSTLWENSPLRAWLNGDDAGSFINTAFSGSEQAAIATTRVRNKKADDYTPNPERPNLDGGSDTDDRIFLLSITDVMKESYGFTNDLGASETREARNTEYMEDETNARTELNGNGYWWLRSPGYGNEYAAIAAANGRIIEGGGEVERDDIAVRPALNLNKRSLLFVSSARGGRTSAIGPDSLSDPGKNTSGEWKATVKDRAHQDFRVVSATTCDHKTIDIEYSGVPKGEGEYITAMIRSGDGKVKLYGKLAAAEDPSGMTKVNIDGKMDEGDTLCVLNEQLNDDCETDFSSPLQEIAIPKELHRWDAGRVTKEATPTETGVRTYTCTCCGATKSETTPVTGKWANPLNVKGKTVKVKYKKLKKKSQNLAAARVITFVQEGQGELSYKLISAKKGKKSFKKKFKVNAGTGRLTVKKGLKKGTYKVKVGVSAAGSDTYMPSDVGPVTITIKVK